LPYKIDVAHFAGIAPKMSRIIQKNVRIRKTQ
jgi:hypothetical protein